MKGGLTILMPVDEPSVELDSFSVEIELLLLYSKPAEMSAPKPKACALAETVVETSKDWVETEPLVTLLPEPWLQLTLTVLPELSVAQPVAGSAVRGVNPAYSFCSRATLPGYEKTLPGSCTGWYHSTRLPPMRYCVTRSGPENCT